MTDLNQSELALLGCIVEDAELAFDLMPEWFDDLRIADAVHITRSVVASGKPCNSVELARQGVDKVLMRSAQEECHSTAHFPSWREDVMQGYEKRRLKAAATKFLNALPSANGTLRSHVLELDNALMAPGFQEKGTFGPKECANRLTKSLEDRFERQGQLSGLQSGFTDLDRITDGIQFKEMTLLAARPSIGKTGIACNIVDRVCLKNKIPTLFLSLEMSSEALTRRMLSGNQDIDMNVLKTGRFSKLDFEKIALFNTILSKSPLHIRESFGKMGASEAASIIRRGVNKDGIKFVVLDYLQKLKSDGRHEKRTYEVADTSATLCEVCKNMGVAFLGLAQLNRENEKDKGRRPRLSDLADSGQIERDADNVLLLHRNRGENPNQAELIVAKQRDGETGMVHLIFDGTHCKFLAAERI